MVGTQATSSLSAHFINAVYSVLANGGYTVIENANSVIGMLLQDREALLVGIASLREQLTDAEESVRQIEQRAIEDERSVIEAWTAHDFEP
jgi:hypothetical protein